MSGLNLSYEIDNGGGEITYFADRHIKEPLHLANIIAGEIVNEILDNAFDIVTKSNNTDSSWNHSDNVCELKKSNLITQDPFCLDVGNAIIEAVEKNPEEKVNELEMRKLKSETLGPYDVITYDTIHAKCGVEEHPFDNKTDCCNNVIESENIISVEKKLRVTDLIKNSPQVITEYLMIDEKIKRNQDEWEETEEKVIQVIELDVDVVKIEPKPSILISEEDENEKEILQVPVDDGMDIIDLSYRAFKKEEKQIINSQLAKGDQQECTTEQVSPRNGNTVNSHSLSEKDCCEELSENKSKENKFKKKKWSFGAKLWGFLKKNNKHESTSTSKIDKQ